MPSPVAEILGALGRALDELQVGWYLFGAQAALARGSRRLTEDIDVTVLLGEVTPELLINRLQASGFSVRVPNVEDFIAVTRVLPFVHDATMMPVDVVIGGPGLVRMKSTSTVSRSWLVRSQSRSANTISSPRWPDFGVP